MQIRTLESILADQPILQGLQPRHLALLAGCASNAVFQPGQFLFHEGHPSGQFFLMRTGGVAIQLVSAGRGALTLETVGPGELLGWSWLFPPHRWRFDARALELTRVISFQGECLRAKCDEDLELGYEFLRRFAQVVVRRLEATRLQLLDLYGPGR